MKKEYSYNVFQCSKCGHQVYIDKEHNILDLLETWWPECGEEPRELWILMGEGDFENLSLDDHWKEYCHKRDRKATNYE